MIEEIVLRYLEEKLGIGVYMEEPVDFSGDHIVIEKTGGGSSDFIDSAVMAIQSYSDTLYHAAKLNDKVKKAMEDIVELPEISNCTMNSDYNFTDTSTKRYRYQAVFNIVYYS